VSKRRLKLKIEEQFMPFIKDYAMARHEQIMTFHAFYADCSSAVSETREKFWNKIIISCI
jgi:hypothetical protein